MCSLAGGTVAKGFADNYPKKAPQKTIPFRISEVKRLLGISLSPAEVQEMLGRLDFACEQVPGEETIWWKKSPACTAMIAFPPH